MGAGAGPGGSLTMQDTLRTERPLWQTLNGRRASCHPGPFPLRGKQTPSGFSRSSQAQKKLAWVSVSEWPLRSGHPGLLRTTRGFAQDQCQVTSATTAAVGTLAQRGHLKGVTELLLKATCFPPSQRSCWMVLKTFATY